MNGYVPSLVSKLYAEKDVHNPSCDVSSSAVKIINAPMPSALYLELQAMASIVHKDVNCLAGELLTVAVEEAMSSLTEDDLHHLHDVKTAEQKSVANSRMERQVYDAGAT